MAEGKPAGHGQVGAERLMFDLTSKSPIPASDLPPKNPGLLVPSARETFKSMHRFRFISTLAVAVNPVAAVVFGLMIFTGLVHYFRLLASRRKLGRGALLWRAGGWWRDLHRWLSVVAGIFVIVLTVTGLGLAINCLGQELYIRAHLPAPSAVPYGNDPSPPPPESELTAATHTRFNGLYHWVHRPSPGLAPSDPSSPLRDSELTAMTLTTLSAFHSA